jgi:hypothetical protein
MISLKSDLGEMGDGRVSPSPNFSSQIGIWKGEISPPFPTEGPGGQPAARRGSSLEVEAQGSAGPRVRGPRAFLPSFATLVYPTHSSRSRIETTAI